MLLFNLQETQPFGSSIRHGGGKNGEVVFKRMVERGLEVCAVYDSRRWFNPEVQDIINANHINLIDSNISSIETIIKNNKIKKYYTPLVNRRSVGDYDCEIFGQIHGLRQLETPNDFYQIYYKPYRNILHYARQVILGNYYKNVEMRFFTKLFNNKQFHPFVVSNHTANAIKVYYPQMKDSEIPVFYSPPILNGKIIKERKSNEKYFLIVSASISYKNALRAIKALDNLFSNGFLSEFKVKIAGALSSNSYRYKIKCITRFEFLGYVEDNALAQLYHDAYCLIYPSLNEGFGSPPLEAMQYGVPILLSAISAIPEIAGCGGVYFCPFCVEEIMNRILMISDKKTHQSFSDEARKRFSVVYQKQCTDLERLIDYVSNY
jgi:glycosyltransferase involved in cell wall biosynthesis